MGYILTATGRTFDYERVNEFLYSIEDIAHSLAKQCRFVGHTKRFYSVAEHSRLVATILKARGATPPVQLFGLLHDLSEAYIGDMPTPLKQMFPLYKELETKILAAAIPQLAGRGLMGGEAEIVKWADGVALAMEVDKLMPKEGRTANWIGAVNSAAIEYGLCWPDLPRSESEEKLFSEHYYRLMGECK